MNHQHNTLATKQIAVLSMNINICLTVINLKCVRLDDIQYNRQRLADAIPVMSVASVNAIGL